MYHYRKNNVTCQVKFACGKCLSKVGLTYLAYGLKNTSGMNKVSTDTNKVGPQLTPKAKTIFFGPMKGMLEAVLAVKVGIIFRASYFNRAWSCRESAFM